MNAIFCFYASIAGLWIVVIMIESTLREFSDSAWTWKWVGLGVAWPLFVAIKTIRGIIAGLTEAWKQ